MNWFKPIYSTSMQNFRKWKNDCRVWIAFFIVLIFIHSFTKGLSNFCDYAGLKSSPWIFPFLYMNNYNKLLFFFPLILIFSNAPFVDSNQLYVIVRTGRVKWCLGQLSYVFTTSAVYFAFIMLFSILLNMDCIEFTNDWGKILNTLANTNASMKYQIGFTPDKDVIRLFTPLSAMMFTFLHSWISGVILGLITFLFNMQFKGVGSFVASFLLVFSAVAQKMRFIIKFSPISWSTLNCIQLKSNDGLPSYAYVSACYIGIVILLIAAILLYAKKYNLDNDLKK